MTTSTRSKDQSISRGSKPDSKSGSHPQIEKQPSNSEHFNRTGQKPQQTHKNDERLTRPPYKLSEEKEKNGFKAKYHGQCYCGNVSYEIDQDPVDASMCHCTTCGRLHGAPCQWSATLPKDSVHFLSGEDQLHFYSPQNKKMEYSLPCKISCGLCQSPIADEGRNMMLMFPPLIKGPDGAGPQNDHGPFRARYHMFYGSRVKDINDDLPKFGGKKGEDPLNNQGEKLAGDMEKKKEEKEEKEKDEDGEKEKNKDKDNDKDKDKDKDKENDNEKEDKEKDQEGKPKKRQKTK